jgi:hypothetical protein
VGCAKLHEEGELLEGTIKLGLGIFVENGGSQWDFLGHAAEANDKIKAESIYWFGGDPVDGAGAFQADALGGKPIGRVPIFRGKLREKGEAKTGQVQIAAIVRFEAGVINPEETYRFGRWARWKDLNQLGISWS